MQPSKVICRRCLSFGDGGGLKENLERYIERMAPEEKCSDEAYAMRLAICDDCGKMINGMCGYCGCFVITRAVKKRMICPEPSGDRWMHIC